ncbi:MAG TPA: hypothetical protein VGP87_12730 [Gemmatimonadales bacterium]|jgi:hypothetical protein|nr:hypothetical protein [Gemmatimonadales bacterium]
MNIIGHEAESDAIKPAGDYFLVGCENGSWMVSTEMARFIETVLDARPRVRWVRFVDTAGSRIRLRTGKIDVIVQCSTEQRARDREISRSLARERKADRHWNEQD